jgi:HEXXH motif-containing protein
LKRTGPQPGFHQLAHADLLALAKGQYTGSVIRHLRSAELSKNLLLLEAVRREVARAGSANVLALIDSAREVLHAVQAVNPGTVTGLFTLPNFGAWAAECLIRLRASAKDAGRSVKPNRLGVDIGHLAAFAAVAALRTRQICRLRLPVRGGIIHLPTLGHARIPAGDDASWADFASDGRGATITSASWSMRLSVGGDSGAVGSTTDWTPAQCVTATSDGLQVRLILEDADPFLAQLAPLPYSVSPELTLKWQERLAEAWQLLTRYHRSVAIGIAEALTAIIPSAELERGRPVTATSGWAWGSVLLSLPADTLSFAEALTHEFHHLVLAAIEDITPLMDTVSDDLCYAPWRDDPRPRSALLQGSYAFFGVTGFWLRQSGVGSPTDKRNAQIEFARRSQNVSEALAELLGWPGLTAAGQLFTSKMADQLAEFPVESVTPSAAAIARRANAEHRARWLRANAAQAAVRVPR